MILPLMPRQVYVPKAGTLTKPAEDNPANQPFDPMANVIVQPTTTVSGYDSEYLFEAPLALNDGDDIAYCADESPPPAGCDPP